MSIRHFFEELEKGLPQPVYFLYADDPYLLTEAALGASRAVPEGERDFCFSSFDLTDVDEKPSFGSIFDVLNTMPFMGGRRIVVVENVQQLVKKDVELLGVYLSNPAPSAVLVLLHKGSPKARFQEFARKAKAITLNVREQELPGWIQEKARQKGLTFTDSAVEYLLGVLGPDVGLISSEIDKCSLIGKARIDRADLAGIVGGSGDYDVFDLVDALRNRDRERVFTIARRLQETADAYSLLGAINWHYSRIAARDKGRAAVYGRIFRLLHEADLKIKTSGGNFPLEYLLLRLLQA